MRNLDERMAEIDRRSKAVFAKRKQRRKQILSVCIPLELCLIVAFLTFQGQRPEPDVTPALKGEHTLGGVTDGGTLGEETDSGALKGEHTLGGVTDGGTLGGETDSGTLGGETDSGALKGETDGATLGGIHNQKTVKVTGAVWFRYYRSPKEVNRIILALGNIMDSPIGDVIPEGDSAPSGSVVPDGTSDQPICQITVTDISGAKQTYYLYKTVLVEKETGKHYAMTLAAARELQKALDLL